VDAADPLNNVLLSPLCGRNGKFQQNVPPS
jgi:hypothetical protein